MHYPQADDTDGDKRQGKHEGPCRRRTSALPLDESQAFLDALLNVARAINAQTRALAASPYKSYAFAGLPAAPPIGLVVVVTDSNTAVWGAAIAGGGCYRANPR